MIDFQPNAVDDYGNPIALSTSGGRVDILERAKAERHARENGAMWTDDTESLHDELIAEVEDLRTLIDLTANNFLVLEPGIAWEGGIDEAMNAIVSEVERLRSDLRTWGEDYKKLQARYDDSLRAFEASEEFRRAYMNGKYQMYALGNDAITAAVEEYLPCNEGPLDRKFRELIELPRLKAKAARIEELEALNESLMENGNDLRDRAQKAEEQLKEIEEGGDCLTVAYLLGGNKKAAENKVLIAYVKRLEAAFLEAEEARLYHELPIPLVCEKKRKAREALERIKEGKG